MTGLEGIIERNYPLVIEHLQRHVDISLEVVDGLLDEKFSGIGFLLKPMAKLAYNLFGKSTIKKKLEKAMETVPPLCKELLLDGVKIGSEELVKVAEEHWSAEEDSIAQFCDKSHDKFEKIEKLGKEGFVAQLNFLMKLLSTDGGASTYPELFQESFESPEKCKDDLNERLSFTERAVEIMKEHRSLVSVPMFKSTMLDLIAGMQEKSMEQFKDNADDLFNDRESE